MLNNYLKIALRTVQRRKGFALINVFGLAMGMAVCLLIILFIQDQRSHDRFHEKADRITRILSIRDSEGDQMGLAASPAYLAPALQRDVPAVEQTLRLGQIRTDAEADGKALYVEGLFAEPSFFDLFDFSLIAGDPRTALVGTHRILLSDKAARKFFGSTEAVGKTITLAGHGDPYLITGVVQTEGVRSHLRFDVLASFETLNALDFGRSRLADENNFWSFATYLLLRDGASSDALEQQLTRYAARYTTPPYAFVLQPLTRITLGPALSNEISAYSLPGFIVWALAGLGLVVMLAAGFNYVGLAVAQSVQRAREVGVRKSIGAERRQLVLQFLAESVMMTLGALLLAVAFLSLLVPSFNNLAFIQSFAIHLAPEAIYQPALLGIFALFALLVGLLAGAYPAFRLSRFRPVLVLKGQLDTPGGAAPRLRHALAFVQLFLSFVFIITTVLLFRQVDYMMRADLGFHAGDLLTVTLQGNDHRLLRDELLRDPDVLEVAATSMLPSAEGTTGSRLAHGSDTLRTLYLSVSPGFLESLGITLLAGRDFQETATGSQPGFILNETAVRRLGYETPEAAVGALVWFNNQEEEQPVLGVVRDFAVSPMPVPIEPVLLYNDPAQFNTALVHTRPGRTQATEARLRAVWTRLDGTHALESGVYAAKILDNEANRLFRDLTGIIGLVACIALTIACLGLLSMAAYNAARRTKEVGIRKVLGAGLFQILWLLSREFLVLMVAAAVVAVPLAYVGNHLWLDAFARRVDFGIGILLAGAAVVILLALVAIASQAVRGALADPVDSLRYE